MIKIISLFVIICIYLFEFKSEVKGAKKAISGKDSEILYYYGAAHYFFYIENTQFKYLEMNIREKSNLKTKKFKNKTYNIDVNTLNKSDLQKYYVSDNIALKSGKLFYSGKEIILPKGVTVRTYYKIAIEWHDHIIVLVRTSNTDSFVKYSPPTYATEIILFNPKDMQAEVLIGGYSQPTDCTGLYLLIPIK